MVVLLLGVMMTSVGPQYFGQLEMPPLAVADYNNLSALGDVLYTEYAYPFEIAGVILLAAIIASITLTHRGPVRRKVQSIDAQVATRREDCVRLVNMPSEGKRSDLGSAS